MKKILFLLIVCAIVAGCDKKETYDPRVSGGIVPYEGIKWGDSQELVHSKMMEKEIVLYEPWEDGIEFYMEDPSEEGVACWGLEYQDQKLKVIYYGFVSGSGGAAQEWERILSTTGIEQKENPFVLGEYYTGNVGNVKIECLYYGEDAGESQWTDSGIGFNIDMKISPR